MKKCIKCNLVKPYSDYYKHSQMSDGHLNKCKECTKKDTKKNRLKKIDYYKEYDRKRFQEDPRVKARHKKYQNSDNGKISMKKSRKAWLEKNKIKRAAHILVNNRLRDGTLVKSSVCENCNKEDSRIHGHHDDYNFPLNVRWLCPKCHTKWHRDNGEGKY